MSRERREATGRESCCSLPPGVPALDLDTRAGRDPAPGIARLAAVARALADPVRLRILALMAAAGPCCEPPAAAGAAGSGRPGVCVCELRGVFGLAQSTVSHHLRVLREAGLVRESRRGKWTFYRVDEDAARAALAALAAHLGVGATDGRLTSAASPCPAPRGRRHA